MRTIEGFQNKSTKDNDTCLIKCISFYLLCIVFIFETHAQTAPHNKLDSLLVSLKQIGEKEDTTTVNLLNNIVRIYLNKNLDSANFYTSKSLELAAKIDYKKGIARAFHLKGLNEYFQGEYDSCLVSTFSAYERYKKLNDSYWIVKCLQVISVVYERTANDEKAISYAKEALTLSEKIDNKRLNAKIITALANVYFKSKNKILLDSAEFYYQKALRLYKQIDYKNGISIALNNLGTFYQAEGEFDKAFEYLEESLKMDRISQSDLFGMCGTLLSLAENRILAAKPEEAHQYLDESVHIAKKHNYQQLLMRTYGFFEMLYLKLEDYNNAHKSLRMKVELEFELIKKTQTETIEGLHVKHETEKKEQEIQSLEQQASIKELELSQRNNQLLAGGLAALLIIAGGFFYYRWDRSQKNKKAVELEQRFLRSQLNPHFIFNSMTAIQQFLIKENPEKASDYMGMFSTLMRQILENSREEFISLKEEISMLKNYMDLQMLRFGKNLKYEIIVDEELDEKYTGIPPMFAQPFIENSLEHGLFKKDSTDKITIKFSSIDEHTIGLEIEDTGIGIKQKTEKINHKSLATKITQERLSSLNFQNTKTKFSSENILSDGEIEGLRIQLTLPTKLMSAA